MRLINNNHCHYNFKILFLQNVNYKFQFTFNIIILFTQMKAFLIPHTFMNTHDTFGVKIFTSYPINIIYCSQTKLSSNCQTFRHLEFKPHPLLVISTAPL